LLGQQNPAGIQPSERVEAELLGLSAGLPRPTLWDILGRTLAYKGAVGTDLHQRSQVFPAYDFPERRFLLIRPNDKSFSSWYPKNKVFYTNSRESRLESFNRTNRRASGGASAAGISHLCDRGRGNRADVSFSVFGKDQTNWSKVGQVFQTARRTKTIVGMTGVSVALLRSDA